MTKMIGSVAVAPSLDSYSTEAEFPLGSVINGEKGKKYRYVKFLDAVAYKATDVVTIATETWGVTKDRSGGSAIAGLFPVGVIHTTAVPTQDQFGWVQIAGVATITAGSAAIVAGDYIKPDATEDGDADEATVGTDQNIIGVALATIADNATGSILLTIGGV